LTNDLLGGQIAMSFDTVTPVLQHIKAGKLRVLAVTTARRSSALPDVPTLDEAGFKGFDIGTHRRQQRPDGPGDPRRDRQVRQAGAGCEGDAGTAQSAAAPLLRRLGRQSAHGCTWRAALTCRYISALPPMKSMRSATGGV